MVVVGAGISGLGTARYLADKGQDVSVLEARERIGGRVWTSQKWAGVPLDLGASWIPTSTATRSPTWRSRPARGAW
nr:FAD-dependent oxidoreductase [Streptomyces sp. CBMA123]